MNTAALLGPYHAERVLAWENGHPMTYGRFLSDVGALADLLPEKPTVINLAEDRYRFLVGFAAALVRGQTTLLPPSRAPGALAQIAREYSNSYCLVDGPEHVEQLPSYQIPKGTQNPTDSAKVPQIPVDHPTVVAFTSGSTGHPHPHSKTWGSLVTIARSTGARLGLKTSDQMTVVATVPHQHMYGLEASIMLPLQHGMAFHVGRPLFPEDVRLALADVPSPRMLVTTPLHIQACVTARSRLPPVECILSATAPLSAPWRNKPRPCSTPRSMRCTDSRKLEVSQQGGPSPRTPGTCWIVSRYFKNQPGVPCKRHTYLGLSSFPIWCRCKSQIGLCCMDVARIW